MPPRSRSSAKSLLRRLPLLRAFLDWRSMMAMATFVAASLGYWSHLLQLQQQSLDLAKSQVQLRAAQLASAMGAQVSTLLGGLEYLAHSLSVQFQADGTSTKAFEEAVQAAMDSFPEGALLQIAIADAQGLVVYSNLENAAPRGGASVSIADREHFKVHAAGGPTQLYLSKPVLGRVSGKWTVQLSYPIRSGSQLEGVVVLSIAPEYLSQQLRDIFANGRDVALLIRADGSYLSRSNLLADALSRSAPADWEFLRAPQMSRGEYAAVAPEDAVHRLYAWQRLNDHPVVVSVGLDSEYALSPTIASIQESRVRNGIGTGALTIAALWITWLFHRQRHDRDRLRKQQQHTELALSGGNLGIWTWSLDSGSVHFDARWYHLLGFPEEHNAHTVRSMRALLHPSDWARLRRAVFEHLRGRTPAFEAEARVLHANEEWRWVHVRGRITHRKDGGPAARVTGTYLDVTEQHQLQEQRLELQQRLTKLLAQVPGTVYQYRVNPDGSSSVPYASPGIVALYGLPPGSASQDAEILFTGMHPDDRRRVRQSIVASARTLAPWSCEWRQTRADGQVRWLTASANPEREADGGILWHGYIHDVTLQHATLEALRQSEQRLRLTVGAVRDGLWEWHTETDTIRFDDRCAEIMEYPLREGEMPAAEMLRLLHPDERMALLTQLQKHLALQEPFSVTVRALTGGGPWRWVELRGQAADRKVIGTMTDITQRMADSQLQRALLNNAAAALFVTDHAQIIQLANHRAQVTFSPDGLPLEKRSMELLHRDSQAFAGFDPFIQSAEDDGSNTRETLLRTADGTLRWFSIRATPLDGNQPDGDLIWTLVDTTERRRAEEALATTKAHLTEVIQHFPGGVLVQDEAGSALVANQALCDLFELHVPYTEVIGKTREELIAITPARVLASLPSRERPPPPGENLLSYEVNVRKDRTVRVDLVPMRTGRGDPLGRLWIAQDITERRRQEQTLHRMATTDSLTGLANRRAFLARLNTELAHIQDGGPPGMLMMLDLDHFKRVNDTWGHAVGDAVLVHLARLLKGNLLRREDLAGRLGGEEFAVLLPGTSLDDSRQIAERLRMALEQSHIACGDGSYVQVTMSAGLAPLVGDEMAILGTADEALYDAKHAGRNRVVARTDMHSPGGNGH